MKEIYFYSGKKVVLLYPNDAVGFTPLSTDGSSHPYELTEELCTHIKEQGVIPSLTGDDAYSGYAEPEEIVHSTIQCFENEQKLSEDWVRKSYAEKDEAHRELAVVTDGYYDWTSERKRFIDRYSDGEYEADEELREEWNGICSQYAQPFDGDDISFESVFEV